MISNFNYKKTNNILGWFVFCIAFFVYTATVEETASFWDCGEFISVSYKLEVPHPPGAPFFLLMGRLFSFFSGGDLEKVALSINMLSVVSSAFTILFIFWAVSFLAKKALKIGNNVRVEDGMKIMGCSFIGAVSYIFCDSFWYSAVEAEVYAMSSFFTAFIFWAMLKWSTIEEESRANRWLLLIFYMIGLSIGVHLLNLTTIPALAILYYFKKKSQSKPLGIITYFIIGCSIVVLIMFGIITGLPSIASKLEIFFVNSLHLPFGSGASSFFILLIIVLIFLLYYSYKNKKDVLHTFLLGTVFVLIGYSSYLIIPIRSNYNTPIDENNPENVMTFLSYLKREQYGNRPLLYGKTFDAKRVDVKVGEPLFKKGKDRYEIYAYKMIPVYEGKKKQLFPRIYSQSESHPKLYQEWIGIPEGKQPSMGDNLKFFFKYQIGHMYLRYFLWNFSGRESNHKNASAMTPVNVLDKNIPKEIKKNKARKNFYMIPFILGVIGLVFHYNKDKKGFLIVLLLFLLTGIGLVMYLNSPPVEPRERDYIYSISFSFFCIWIGFGFLSIYHFLRSIKYIFQNNYQQHLIVFSLAMLLAFSIPLMMAVKGWASHDRSNRFYSIDQAKNMLDSCAPNAILFTGGDNDTFPLWYLQEVEGFRTDIRVIVLSYFTTDWYIEQMRRKTYLSEPIPLSLTPDNYAIGTNEYIPLVQKNENSIVNLEKYMELVKSENKAVYTELQDETKTAVLLSNTFYLDVDTTSIALKNSIPEDKLKYMTPRLYLSLNPNTNYIMKNDLAILDMIQTNKWERPIYFNLTSANSTNINFKNYLHLEGFTYRFLPIFSQDIDDLEFENDSIVSDVSADIMLENMKKFEPNFRGLQDPSIYVDDEYRRFGANTRNNFYKLAKELIRKGRKEEAKEVMDFILTKIPKEIIPLSFYAPNYAQVYIQLKEDEKALEIIDILIEQAEETINYFQIKKTKDRYLMQKNALIINTLINILIDIEKEEYQERYEKVNVLFKRYLNAFQLIFK